LSQTAPIQLGCLECDLLVSVDALSPGERGRCPRCNHLLTENTADSIVRSLAFALAAACLLALALSFPFLTLKERGIEQVMTIPGSAVQLWTGGYPPIAVLVMGPIVGIPGLLLAGLVALLLPLRRGTRARWLVPTGRFIFFLNPWSMVEVFVIGVIVSLVKIGSMATVILGVAFWAYAAFALCFIAAFTNLDRVQLWERIEELTP